MGNGEKSNFITDTSEKYYLIQDFKVNIYSDKFC